MKNFAEFGIVIPEILLPKDKNLSVWSVIACDQYTQDQDYWNKVENQVGENASTLNLILPEIYLSSPDRKERIQKIRQTMQHYLSEGIFDNPQKEFIYLERKTPFGRIRRGLVLAIDLDSYQWKPFSKSLIRATEATIVDRIPPRKEIRAGAPIESPHIMLLANDPENILIESAAKEAKKQEAVYDGDLMANSGHITGWAIKDEKALDNIYNALSKLKKDGSQEDGSSFLFAVGDGNHSLATAKAVWDEYKEELQKKGASEKEIAESPVRFALVEIVNIYDQGLTFEPIHRVLFNANCSKLSDFLKKETGANVLQVSSEKELESKVKESKGNFGLVAGGSEKTNFYLFQTQTRDLLVSSIQPLLDKFIKENSSEKNIEIDYIHGSDEVFRLGKEEGNITILLPPVAKDSFFTTISKNGPLPRKSFSMGEASEKRFYLECRRLFS